MLFLIALSLLMSGCSKPAIIGGVDATDIDPLEHPPRKRVFISKEPPQGVSSASEDQDKAQIYINKQSGGVKLERNKVYHWVAEGGEVIDKAGAAPELVSGIMGNDVAPQDVAIIPIDESADSVEPGFLPMESLEPQAGMDAASEGTAPTGVVGDELSTGIADDMISDGSADMVLPEAASDVTPDGEMVDVAFMNAISPEPVPVIIDESPDPVAFFDVSEVVSLVQGYEAAMQARQPDRLNDIFSRGSKLSFAMWVPDQGQVSEKYDIADFTEAHRKGWRVDMDYSFSIRDVMVTVSDDGTTAVAQGVVVESMTTGNVRVEADYDMIFFVEKVGKSLLIVGAESEGSIEGFRVDRSR